MQIEKFRAKNAAESRTEEFKFRLSKRLRFFAEQAARSKGLSLANYIETLLESDWGTAQVAPEDHREANAGTEARYREPKQGDITYTLLSDLADDLYDEDDATRFFKQLAHSWSMSSDQFRMMDLVQCSHELYPRGRYNITMIKEHWPALMAMVQAKRDTGELPASWFKGVDVEYALMNEKERIALFRQDEAEFRKRSQKHADRKKAVKKGSK